MTIVRNWKENIGGRYAPTICEFCEVRTNRDESVDTIAKMVFPTFGQGWNFDSRADVGHYSYLRFSRLA